MATGYKFPILNSDGTASGSKVDMEDMFVPKDQFLTAGLWGFGRNNHGQLGNNTVSNSLTPISFGTLTNWKQSAGHLHTMAIKTDGTLWTCGYNSHGQLGNGTTINYSSPIQIGSLTNWKQVSCALASAAIKTDGTLWTWGLGNQGQLGNGDTIRYSSPIQVGSLTNWKQVSVSSNYFMMAIKTDGTLWGWGVNSQGQLGNGTTVYYSSPIQVGSLTTWSQISAGTNESAAVKTDGTLWVWGNGSSGVIGNGTTVNYSSPVQVGSLNNWKQVSCYGGQLSAIKVDGTLWSWGSNPFGGLGNNTRISYSSPIQIGSLSNWMQVSTNGNGGASAVKTDGTLWAWGYNAFGRIGNNTALDYSSPVQVGSLTTWKQTSEGLWYGLAIQAPDYYWNQ